MPKLPLKNPRNGNFKLFRIMFNEIYLFAIYAKFKKDAQVWLPEIPVTLKVNFSMAWF